MRGLFFASRSNRRVGALRPFPLDRNGCLCYNLRARQSNPCGRGWRIDFGRQALLWLAADYFYWKGRIIMLRVILPIVIALAIIVGCIIYLNYDTSINSGTDDVLYNNIVYERAQLPYNVTVSEANAKYIGDFSQLYAYGQEVLYEVRVLNSEENIVYSAHATWLRPGYSCPSEYGEDFASVEYVVSEGIDFVIIPDNYTEEVTPLATFDGVVRLEDIIESETSEISPTEENIPGSVRFKYKNHADIMLLLDICSLDGQYYLNVCHSTEGTDNWFKIKPEYVALLTSAM